MDGWDLEFYTTASGTAPVREYLESLSKQEEARIARMLVMLERLGTQLGMPHAQKLQGVSVVGVANSWSNSVPRVLCRCPGSANLVASCIW